MTINRVIVVQKTHLDVGFTDLPSKVVEQYCTGFIPQAIALAEELNGRSGDGPRMVWTTGSWLIWQALEKSQGSARRAIEAAIAKGWLRWHALPFTTHSELANAHLLRAGLGIAQELDQRFGTKTRAAKMTDVPGHSLGMVPLLAEAGVRLLHLGVNPASRMPQVPEAFRWRHPQGAEICVLYGSGYGDAIVIPGSDAVLAFLHTNDNKGPATYEVMAAEFAALAARFPQARIEAGTMEDAVALLDPSALPVVESEIGDSWIHGVGSAPQRVADFLALGRCLASHASLSTQHPHAARSALLVAEHTWGLDSKGWLPSHQTLGPGGFAHERGKAAWQPLQAAYAEQDAYLSDAITLAGSELGDLLRSSLSEARSQRGLPQPGASAVPYDRWAPLTTPRWVLRLDPANGVIRQCYDRFLGHDLCAQGGRLGMLRYEILGRERYRRWVESYLLPDEELYWAAEDFGAPDDRGRFAQDLLLPTRADEMWVETVDNGVALTIHHRFRHPRVAETGAPAVIGTRWLLPDDPQEALTLTLGWDHKPAALAREALWLGWRQGSVHQPQHIIADKLDSAIDVGTVVDDGALLHAVEALHLHGDHLHTTLHSLDAPLVCPDGPRLLERRLGAPDYSRGQWWNLLNTAWSTNFGFWTEGAMAYRFRFTIASAAR